MAKLPNADRAIVDIEKFTEYCLNPNHDEGQHKAHVFKTALGITRTDSFLMRKIVQEIAMTHDAIKESSNAYGERYVIDFELTTVVGSAIIRTAWIVRYDEDFPRLTTCYVL